MLQAKQSYGRAQQSKKSFLTWRIKGEYKREMLSATDFCLSTLGAQLTLLNCFADRLSEQASSCATRLHKGRLLANSGVQQAAQIGTREIEQKEALNHFLGGRHQQTFLFTPQAYR